jgi:hypothetical protein
MMRAREEAKKKFKQTTGHVAEKRPNRLRPKTGADPDRVIPEVFW